LEKSLEQTCKPQNKLLWSYWRIARPEQTGRGTEQHHVLSRTACWSGLFYTV